MHSLYKNFIIHLDNFGKEWLNYENTNIKIIYKNNYYEIEIKNTISPCIYYISINNLLIYSFNEELIADYIKSNNLCILHEYEIRKVNDLKLNNHYKEINIECNDYKKIYLYKDSYSYDKIDETLFSIPIENSEYIIKEWINTYQNIFDKYKDDLCIELTAGLDSRMLTYFWRHYKCNKLHIWTHNMLKYDINEAKFVATNLLHVLPIYSYYIKYKNFDYLYNLSGKNGSVYELSNKFLSLTYLQNRFKIESNNKLLDSIVPFLDRKLLQVKANKNKEFKFLLFYILSNNTLRNIPFVTCIATTDNNHIFNNFNELIENFGFNEDYFKNIIKDWDLKNIIRN